MEIKKYKIVAIAQINNEIRKGNLERFFTHLKPVVDNIVIYDDASTDGSFEYAKQHTQHVLRGTKNNFVNEWQTKQTLVEYALTLKPDFILHIDADEVLTDETGEKLQALASDILKKDHDGALLYEHNLWRSHTWRRMDSDFGDVWFLRFWRVRITLSYTNRTEGLHQSPAPDQIKKYERQDTVGLLHYGFATEQSIASKYLSYAKHGQRGENLARFINETTYLRTELVPHNLIPDSLWRDKKKPEPYDTAKWYSLIENHRPTITKPSISIVCLIYQSTAWLQFVYNQVLKYTDLSDKEFFFIANDATPEVKKYLRDNYIPHFVFDDEKRTQDEWYINNVYRAWNYGASKAKGDLILFINSDMAFSPGWVENMLESYTGNNCVSARLVERNTIPKDDCIVQKNFGDHFSNYREDEFLAFVQENKPTKPTADGGPYMPLLIKKEHFEMIGGYPEGNVAPGPDIWNPIIAKKGGGQTPGDVIFMQKLAQHNIPHITVLSAISYHFQEGEMRDAPTTSINFKDEVEVVIVNNSLKGVSGEKMFWNFLGESLPRSTSIDMEIVGANERNFTEKASKYIQAEYPNARFIIQNATFIDIIRPDLHTISLLQDDLRRMGKISLQQEDTLARTHTHVANSFYTAGSYPDYAHTIIPLGLNDTLFTPGDRIAMRAKHNLPANKRIGIFVGNMTTVKGWDKIEQIVRKRSDMHWVIVSKNKETYDAQHVTVRNNISQETLAEFYQAADFFILGSPTETQCLAALEAGLTNIPIIMPLTGIFADWTEEERAECGIFGNNFADAVDEITKHKYKPRDLIIRKELTIPTMIEAWWQLIATTKLTSKTTSLAPVPHYSWRSNIIRKYKVVFSKNFLILIARKHLSPRHFTALIALYRKIKSFYL